jgi:hypothetical protein
MPISMLRRVDEPTKDDVARDPAEITLLDEIGLLTVGRIRRVEGPENFVMKERAVESLVSLAQALDAPDAIIHAQVEMGIVRRAARVTESQVRRLARWVRGVCLHPHWNQHLYSAVANPH